MTPKELLAAAEYLDQLEPMYAIDNMPVPDAVKAGVKLAHHILSTVRADDDEPVTEEWIRDVGLGHVISPDGGYMGHLKSMRVRGIVIQGFAKTDISPRCQKKIANWTRGQFRALCRVLGITLPEVPA